MSWFVDTNILIYAIDSRSPDKKERADLWLRELGHRNLVVLSPQSLNEFYSVATVRIGLPRNTVTRQRTEQLAMWCTAPLDTEVTRAAWRIEDETGYRFFDCLLITSAFRAGCNYFRSEDLQHERRVGELTILNPFVTSPHDFFPTE